MRCNQKESNFLIENRPQLRTAVVAVFSFLFLVACASAPMQHTELALADYQPIELRDTPFFPQEDYQCGPAALATILQVSGVDSADPDTLREQIYIPDRQGSLQTELIAASRRAERIPYVLEPQFSALLAELYAGNPVLVLQNLALARWPQWHYAVVVGFQPDTQTIVLRSGINEREEMSLRAFERTWRLADYWALVVAPNGLTPVTAKPLRYFAAVAAMEQQQRWQAALAGYAAAEQRWPEDATSALGMGNIAYQQRNFSLAEEHYYRASELDPYEPAIFYNLAWALFRQGKVEEARLSAATAASLAPEHSVYGKAVGALEQAQ
ncbi:PA2778 family cysteine peptidase [Idiomarina sp. A28L]|uniref:PA2778 family cysteine peptidase n=1 Tax=Idiomarina sp. A28L TaxID=1036674 RepID=UPI00068096A2|nr:PA2778 family cysteine peptidase [Idiomarina sp. A28L]